MGGTALVVGEDMVASKEGRGGSGVILGVLLLFFFGVHLRTIPIKHHIGILVRLQQLMKTSWGVICADSRAVRRLRTTSLAEQGTGGGTNTTSLTTNCRRFNTIMRQVVALGPMRGIRESETNSSRSTLSAGGGRGGEGMRKTLRHVLSWGVHALMVCWVQGLECRPKQSWDRHLARLRMLGWGMLLGLLLLLEEGGDRNLCTCCVVCIMLWALVFWLIRMVVLIHPWVCCLVC